MYTTSTKEDNKGNLVCTGRRPVLRFKDRKITRDQAIRPKIFNKVTAA